MNQRRDSCSDHAGRRYGLHIAITIMVISAMPSAVGRAEHYLNNADGPDAPVQIILAQTFKGRSGGYRAAPPPQPQRTAPAPLPRRGPPVPPAGQTTYGKGSSGSPVIVRNPIKAPASPIKLSPNAFHRILKESHNSSIAAFTPAHTASLRTTLLASAHPPMLRPATPQRPLEEVKRIQLAALKKKRADARLAMLYRKRLAEAADHHMSLGDQMGFLRRLDRNKGDFGMGSARYDEAMQLGRSWVGDDHTVASDGVTMLSLDELKQFRPPALKPNSKYATTGTQANFQWRSTPKGNWEGNGHLNILIHGEGRLEITR